MIRFRAFAATLTAAVLSTSAAAATIRELSPDSGLGRVDVKHLASNAAGDYLAVTRTQVWVGAALDGAEPPARILAEDRADFVLSDSVTIQADPHTLRVDLDILQTRAALNARGDFVLASNTRLWVGNTRSRVVRQVADAGSFAAFQEVAINDAGHYAAVSSQRLYAGHVEDAAAAKLIDDARGIFDVYSLYGFQQTATVETGEHRLALDAAGRIVAVTAVAVYVGDATEGTATELLYDREAGFRHVVLSGDGGFVIAAGDRLYAGAF